MAHPGQRQHRGTAGGSEAGPAGEGGDKDESDDRTKVSNRKELLDEHAASIGAAGHLIVAEALHTPAGSLGYRVRGFRRVAVQRPLGRAGW
ncbi:hypothetical protein ACGFOM_28905 [Streptomyces sp. NPDC048594]|uniref:hypothetical protein n=1 Tax=Streptomyces sp. NPDC048594 TaxID=3365575 RepID=UPI0037148D74